MKRKKVLKSLSKDQKTTTAAQYLEKPYARRLTPDESGGFVATIQEFPGLVAEGDSAQEALTNLESAARSWIDAALETGAQIPDPVNLYGYSGKIALRMPRGLHKRAAELASAEQVSLNQFLVTAIAQYVGGCMAFHGAIQKAINQIYINYNQHTSVSNTTILMASSSLAFKQLPSAQALATPISYAAPGVAGATHG